jgi:hypothetical protein
MTPRQPWEEPGAVRRDCKPHRAHLLLWLGSASFLLGLLSCLLLPALVAVVLGFIVSAMGSRDLALMADGSMDPAGDADTRRALRWGFVGTALALFAGCPGGLLFLAFLFRFAYPVWR